MICFEEYYPGPDDEGTFTPFATCKNPPYTGRMAFLHQETGKIFIDRVLRPFGETEWLEIPWAAVEPESEKFPSVTLAGDDLSRTSTTHFTISQVSDINMHFSPSFPHKTIFLTNLS